MQSALGAGHAMCCVVVIDWVAGLREADQSWLLLGDPTNASAAAQMHPTLKTVGTRVYACASFHVVSLCQFCSSLQA
jgi:hypothetical protein